MAEGRFRITRGSSLPTNSIWNFVASRQCSGHFVEAGKRPGLLPSVSREIPQGRHDVPEASLAESRVAARKSSRGNH